MEEHSAIGERILSNIPEYSEMHGLFVTTTSA